MMGKRALARLIEARIATAAGKPPKPVKPGNAAFTNDEPTSD
jgi:hypothetical protein